MRTLHSVLFALAVSACTGSAQIHTTAEADYTPPAMVEVEPGVQVVTDYDQPVFYSDNVYWRVEGGVWYRSQYHDRGWARVDAPPERVRHIERPEAYVHFHGHADVHEQHAQGPEIRDHRTNENPVIAPAPTPEVRDHRDEVRADEHERAEVKHDERVEAKDRKDVKKDEKKEQKDERKEAHDEHKH